MTDRDRGTTRRSVLKTTGAGAVALGLAGCIGSADEEEEIRFWHTQVQEDRQEVIRDINSDYEDDAEVEIDIVAVEENDLPSQISSAQAADRLFALAELPLDPMQRLGNEGVLSSDSAEAVVDAVGRDEFYEGALGLATGPDGDLLGVPLHGWVQGFWYRQSEFDDYGLSEPTDWDSLLEAAETLHDPDNDQYGIVVGSAETAFARQCFTPFARSNEARVFNADGEIVFDSPEMIEALEFYAQLSEFSPPGKNTWEDANHTYLNDQCHLIEYSSFIMGDVVDRSEAMTENTNFAPSVDHERRSSFGTLLVMGLNDNVSDGVRDTVEGLTEEILTGDEYIEWLHMAPGGMNPVLTETTESETYKSNPTLEAWGEDTLENISAVFETIERFGYVDGQMFPEFGEITSQTLVAEAVMRVCDGEDAATVAEEQAEKMRDAIA